MGLSIVDYMTGITVATAVLAASIGVMKSGKGGDIDVSLFDVALHQLTYPGAWVLERRLPTERLPRSAHPTAVPVQLLRTSDGWIFVMCMTQKFWEALVRAARPARVRTRRAVCNARSAARASRCADGRTGRRVRAGDDGRVAGPLQGVLPAAPVHDLAQALDNPYVREIGMLRELPLANTPATGCSQIRSNSMGNACRADARRSSASTLTTCCAPPDLPTKIIAALRAVGRRCDRTCSSAVRKSTLARFACTS
jgi:crotonobetainyl-CoA:carnitine CoA-transferase CaiB-like acyl-CoA transferase